MSGNYDRNGVIRQDQFLYIADNFPPHANHLSAVYSHRNSRIPVDTKIKFDSKILAVIIVILQIEPGKVPLNLYLLFL